MRDSFIIYRSFIEAMSGLDDNDRLALLDAVIGYALDEQEPDLDGPLRGMFTIMKPQIDANNRRYENGKKGGTHGGKGGRPKNPTKTPPEPQPNPTETPNVNVNVNANGNENENGNVSGPAATDVWSLSRSVLSHLNKEAGTSYRVDDAEYVRLISDLSHKGYTESQMIEVIDKKCADWLGDPKVEQYLRPRTLFGQKFEEYLNAPASAKMKERAEKKKERDREMAELQRGTEALNRLFEKGQARHEQFMREHGLRSEAANE